MNLIVTWIEPSPYPICNFVTSYRRNYDPQYTDINTSGSTSGTTSGSTSILVSTPANYEGYMRSNCCSNNFSDQRPFGVNAYVQFSISISVVTNNYTATINSPYGNPYPTLLTGTFRANGNLLSYTTTYPANTTSGTTTLFLATSGSAITNTSVTTVAPVFDQGGALQQFDSVNTPPYFQFYWNGNTSGTTWAGSPLDLPSFILRTFNVTAVSPGGDVLAGNLLISWIAGSVYQSGVSPYNEVIFKVYDPDTSLMGTATVPVTSLSTGLLTATIPIVKTTNTIGPATQFTLKTLWGNNSISSTKLFYLPPF